MSSETSNMNSNLKTFENDVNELECSFNKLSETVISKLNECNDLIKSTKQLYQQAIETNTTLEDKLANPSDEKKTIERYQS